MEAPEVRRCMALTRNEKLIDLIGNVTIAWVLTIRDINRQVVSIGGSSPRVLLIVQRSLILEDSKVLNIREWIATTDGTVLFSITDG
jgi:hypothetical protein